MTQQHQEDGDSNVITQYEAIEQTSESTASKSQPKASVTEPQQRTPIGLWLFSLFTFCLLVAGVAAAYWYLWPALQTALNVSQQQQQIEQEQVRTQQTIARQQSELATVQQALSSASQQNQQLESQLAELNEQLLNAQNNDAYVLAQLQALNGRRPADWLLAEADYLVRMAARKLWLEQDKRTALLLLENADQRLTELDDPSVLPVRRLIATDQQALEQTNPVAISSVALALDGLLGQVPELPLNNLKIVEPDNQQTTEMTDSVNDWKQNLALVWRSLVDDFIRVERRDTEVEPLLSAQQQFLISEQLRLALAQAQSGAIAREESRYQRAIQQALALVIEHYNIDDHRVSGFVSALNNLATTDVSLQLPPELGAQKVLSELVRQRVQNAYSNEGAL